MVLALHCRNFIQIFKHLPTQIPKNVKFYPFCHFEKFKWWVKNLQVNNFLLREWIWFLFRPVTGHGLGSRLQKFHSNIQTSSYPNTKKCKILLYLKYFCAHMKNLQVNNFLCRVIHHAIFGTGTGQGLGSHLPSKVFHFLNIILVKSPKILKITVGDDEKFKWWIKTFKWITF